ATDTGSTFLQQLAEKIGAQARASVVFGEPIDREGVTIIPVARARWGFGGGSGQEAASDNGEPASGGGGGGGGMMVSPVGYIEVKNGSSTYRPIVNPPVGPVMIVVGILLGLFLLRKAGRRRGASTVMRRPVCRLLRARGWRR
ncbi:MAG: GerW family sporulation protein, partial [Chloroflexota bacterium]